MYVCLCNNITVRQLAAYWAETQPDLDRLAERMGLYSDNCCGRCAEELESLVDTADLPSGLPEASDETRTQVSRHSGPERSYLGL